MKKSKIHGFTLKDVEQHYEKTLDYDDINDVTPSHDKRFIDGINLSNIKDSSYVLNILCRSGKAEAYYNKKRKSLKFESMDVSERLLREAKRRFEENKVNGNLHKLTSLSLPFRNSTFDNIISYETLEHIPDPKKLICEFSRVLKKGGELIISTPNTSWDWIHSLVAFLGIHHSEGPHRMIPRKEIILYLNESGFKITNEKTVILIPVGPKILRGISELVERFLGEKIRRRIAMRRYFVAIKD